MGIPAATTPHGALPGEEVRRLEDAALRSWPALSQRWYDGWLVRRAGGYTKRANSASLLQCGRLTVEHKISRCEAYYRACGQRPIFRLTPLGSPERSDAALAARGYVILDPTDVLTLGLDTWQPPEKAAGEWRAVAPLDWLAAYAALSGAAEAGQHIHRQLLQRIASPVIGAVVMSSGMPASCGLAVVDGDLLGVFDVVTGPAWRRRGLARTLLASLLGWGRQMGARTAYLQVVAANRAAQGLYRGLGFGDGYRYWYRVPGA